MADNSCMCESYTVRAANKALLDKSNCVFQSCVWGPNDIVETHCYMLWIARELN